MNYTQIRRTLLRLAALTLASAGCAGSLDADQLLPSDPALSSAAGRDAASPRSAHNAATGSTSTPAPDDGDAGPALSASNTRTAADAAQLGSAMDSPDSSNAPAPVRHPNLRIERSARFDGYLTDGFGRALYMFVADTPGQSDSACLGECARTWPPFHLGVAQLSGGLALEDIAEFHRQDGSWQTSYKGHPLYYRATEQQSIEVTGDGIDERWFVARDYLMFLATARTFTPAAGAGPEGDFLTDGAGHTLYVCLDDQPRTAASDAVSSCDARCTLDRPVFAAVEADRTTLLPSVLGGSELRELLRPDGQRQLTYRGWPLYRYAADSVLSATAGHNEQGWRAIDPVQFALGD